MKSWETTNGYKIYQVLSGRSNSYLVSKGSYNILIDTGKSSAYQRLKQNIDLLDLTEKKISFLILTHTHFDHCQNARQIRQECDCQTLVSEKVLKEIKNGYTPLPKGTILVPRLISNLGRLIGKRKYGYPSFVPDVLINSNYRFDNEYLAIKLISTPGHSIDSMSIIVDNEIAIVGDAIFGIFRNSVFPPPYADDSKEMVMSWAKLLNTGCELFFPGHGRVVPCM